LVPEAKSDEVARAVTLPVAPVWFARMVFAAICGSCERVSAFAPMEKEFAPAAYEHVTPEEHEAVVVATPVHAPPENART
jgi:hypothetical protein